MSKLKRTDHAPAFDMNRVRRKPGQGDVAALPHAVIAATALRNVASILHLPIRAEYSQQQLARELPGLRARLDGTPTAKFLKSLQRAPVVARSSRINRVAQAFIKRETGVTVDLKNNQLPFIPTLRDVSFYAVTSDGYVLLGNRSNAKGFAARGVAFGTGFIGSDQRRWTEAPHIGAAREAREEMGISPPWVSDLGIARQNTFLIWTLQTRTKGKTALGLVGAESYIGFHQFDKTLAEMVKDVTVAGENSGLIAFRPGQIKDGQVQALYFSSCQPAALRLLEDAKANTPNGTDLSLAEFREHALRARKNGDKSRLVPLASKARLVLQGVPLTLALTDCDQLGRNSIVEGLAIGRKLGLPITPEGEALIAERGQYAPRSEPRLPLRPRRAPLPRAG